MVSATTRVTESSNAVPELREAERLHRAIFRESPTSAVAQRFDEAVAMLKAAAPESDVAIYHRVLLTVADLEALEVAARHRKRLSLLPAAFRLMVYLAETDPGNQRFFVKRRAGLAGAVASLLAGGLRTSYKLAKGLVLLARTGHA